MINVTATNRKVEVVLGGATTTNPVEIVCVYKIWIGYGHSPGYGCQTATVSGTTPVTICPAPTGGRTHQIVSLNIYNADTADITLSAVQDESATDNIFFKISVPSGYHAGYDSQGGFQVLDDTGSLLRNSSLPLLFLNYFEGTPAANGPFTDEVAGITWTEDNDGGTTTFVALDKFGSTSAFIPAAFPGANTLECGDFTDLTGKSWTVEAWINLEGGESSSNIQMGVGKVGSHSANISWNLNITSDLMGCVVKLVSNVGGELAAGSSINLSQDVWYHAAFQYDAVNGNYELYFNGVRYIQYNTSSIADPDNDFMLTHNASSVGFRVGSTRGVLGLVYSGATYSVPTTEF